MAFEFDHLFIFGHRPDQASPAKAQSLTHPLGLREISRVEIS